APLSNVSKCDGVFGQALGPKDTKPRVRHPPVRWAAVPTLIALYSLSIIGFTAPTLTTLPCYHFAKPLPTRVERKRHYAPGLNRSQQLSYALGVNSLYRHPLLNRCIQ